MSSSAYKACPFGTHRCVGPDRVLPQAARRLDNSVVVYDTELHLAVERLNVDSASFRQLREAAGGDPAGVAAAIREIVAARGKLHNPVTGSGGVLVGRVKAVGPGRGDRPALGTRVVTLVSLTLTPLRLDRVGHVDLASGQVEVKGTGVIFETGLYAPLPADVPEALALAVLDVCGAPAQTLGLVRPGNAVLVLGAAGKSGLLSCAAARRAGAGLVVGADVRGRLLGDARRLGLVDRVVEADARDPVEFLGRCAGRFDVTVSCVNCAGAEQAAVLTTRPEGTICFFGMSTSFTSAALSAEGVGSQVNMLIGNGYRPGHADLALSLVRDVRGLSELLVDSIGSPPA